MAKANPFKARLKKVEAEIAKQERALAAMQDKLRADPMDADLRARVQDAKRPLIALTDERGFLARAITMEAGGTSYSPLP